MEEKVANHQLRPAALQVIQVLGIQKALEFFM